MKLYYNYIIKIKGQDELTSFALDFILDLFMMSTNWDSYHGAGYYFLGNEKLSEEVKQFYDLLKEYSYYLTMPNDIREWTLNNFKNASGSSMLDLPIFKYDNIPSKDIVLEKKDIFNSSNIFQYFRIDNLSCSNIVNSCFFRLNDNNFLKKYKGDIFFDFIVICNYRELADGKVRCEFIPYTMVKSITTENIWDYFVNFYGDTSYYTYIIEKIKSITNLDNLPTLDDILNAMYENENLTQSIYEVVIFSFNNCIINLFFEHLCYIGIDCKLEWDIVSLKDNYSEEFIDIVTKQRKTFDINLFKTKLAISGVSEDPNAYKDKDSKSIYLKIRNIINNKRYETNLTKRIVTLKEIEKTLMRDDLFNKIKVIKTIIDLLKNMNLESALMFNNFDKTFTIGFVCTENLYFTMPNDFEYIYPYVFAFYYGWNSYEQYEKYYQEFYDWLYKMFEDAKYLENLISKDTFCYLLNYFKTDNGVNKYVLKNKVDSIDFILKELEKSNNYFCQKAFKEVDTYIKQLSYRDDIGKN